MSRKDLALMKEKGSGRRVVLKTVGATSFNERKREWKTGRTPDSYQAAGNMHRKANLRRLLVVYKGKNSMQTS